MALTIELFRSAGGIAPGNFTLLDTISDTGGTLTYTDNDVLPGALYIYRARRRDDSQTGDCQYSDWSALVLLRVPFTEVKSMRCDDKPTTGGESAWYISGPEWCYGIPSKMLWKVPTLSGAMPGQFTRVSSTELSNRRSRRRNQVAGMAMFEGTLDVVVKPEGAFPRLMIAKLPFTTADLTSPTRHTHTWKNGYGSKSVTMVQKIGDLYLLYPGVRAGSFDMGVTDEQDSAISARFALTALDMIAFRKADVPTIETILGIDTASETTLDHYSAVMGLGTVGSNVGDVKSLTFNYNANLGRLKGLNGKRGMQRYYERRGDATGSGEFDFSDDDTERFWRNMGLSANPAGGFAAGDTISTLPVSLVFNPPNNGSSYSNILGIYYPNADIETTFSVNDENEIPEALTFFPVDKIGDASGTDYYVTLVNGESSTDLLNSGTPIDSLPVPNRVREYRYGTVKGSSPTPSTTVFASISTHLSAVDDYYNGRTIKFFGNVTSALAGIEKVVSDYAGSTRTITVSVALGTAPAAGDLFEIQ